MNSVWLAEGCCVPRPGAGAEPGVSCLHHRRVVVVVVVVTPPPPLPSSVGSDGIGWEKSICQGAFFANPTCGGFPQIYAQRNRAGGQDANLGEFQPVLVPASITTWRLTVKEAGGGGGGRQPTKTPEPFPTHHRSARALVHRAPL